MMELGGASFSQAQSFIRAQQLFEPSDCEPHSEITLCDKSKVSEAEVALKKVLDLEGDMDLCVKCIVEDQFAALQYILHSLQNVFLVAGCRRMVVAIKFVENALDLGLFDLARDLMGVAKEEYLDTVQAIKTFLNQGTVFNRMDEQGAG